MRGLIRQSLRGRRGPVLALAITLAFSSALVGTLALLVETGARGRVSTGEYSAPPALLGARQTRPVDGDVDLPTPERALMSTAVFTEVQKALPGAHVVADVIVPAVINSRAGDAESVEAHPWSATELGVRTLASGRAPRADHEIVVSRSDKAFAKSHLGDTVEIGFGGESNPHTIVGVLDAGSNGDRPDVYLSDHHGQVQNAAETRVAAVGVWPGQADAAKIRSIAAQRDVRLWPAEDRGDLEMVRQGRARAELVSGAAAFIVLAIIVGAFTLTAITALQIRERSREIAVLRVVGATPRQVTRLLHGEIRMIAFIAGGLGALAGPLLGTRLVDLLRSWGFIPRTLEPVVGPLPCVAAFAVAFLAAEVATRVAARQAVRGSPLAGLEGVDKPGVPVRKVLAGIAGLCLGLAMAAAPLYTSGEAAVGLPGLAGLVIALSLGPLAPLAIRLAVRLVTRVQERSFEPSTSAYLAWASVRSRSLRVGGALAPIVLGVALSSTQLFSGSTSAAIATAQIEAGHRADLMISAPITGIAEGLADDLTAMPEIDAAEPIVSSSVLIRGNQPDASWQSLRAIAVGGDHVDRYADLSPVDGTTLDPPVDGVTLSTQLGETLSVTAGDQLEFVLPDGGTIQRRVAGLYQRGLGFGDIVLPIGDLQPALASGQPTALAITVGDQASIAEVKQLLAGQLDHRPGLELTAPTEVPHPPESSADTAFPVLLLIILWSYIAIAVVNSLVIMTLARRREFALLRVIGATPSERRRTARWEAVFLATSACLLATIAILPGLCGLTYALSNGERLLPSISITVSAGIVAVCFALVLTAIELPVRRLLRANTSRPGGGRI